MIKKKYNENNINLMYKHFNVLYMCKYLLWLRGLFDIKLIFSIASDAALRISVFRRIKSLALYLQKLMWAIYPPILLRSRCCWPANLRLRFSSLLNFTSVKSFQRYVNVHQYSVLPPPRQGR